jgi:hypothetical protein
MLIKLLGQEVALSDQQTTPVEILRTIDNMLALSQMALDFLRIDGIEVRENYEAILTQNWQQIGLIEIKAKSTRELAGEQLQDAQVYLERALPEVAVLADEFYSGAVGSTWEKLDSLLEGLQWLARFTYNMQNPEVAVNCADYQQILVKMLKKLGELGSALQVMDQTLIAYLIKYEITALLEELRLKVDNTVMVG